MERISGFNVQPGNHRVSCFGYVDGRFFGGTRHHMAIMDFLLKHGYDFESLMNAKQAWGWILNEYDPKSSWAYTKEIQFRLSTDAAAIDKSLEPAVAQAITAITGLPAKMTDIWHPSNSDYAPSFNALYGEEGSYYSDQPIPGVYVYDSATGEHGWYDESTTQQFPPPSKEEPQQQTLFDHPNPGGGNPPPKMAMWKEAERAKFVYDTSTGELNATYDWKAHHEDLLEGMGYDPDNLAGLDLNTETSFIFGEHYPDENPIIHHEHLIPQHLKDAALDAYWDWAGSDAYWNWKEAGSQDGRYVWLIDHRGLRFGQRGEHHIDIGWGGGEAATGDVLVNEDQTGHPTPGQIVLRMLTLQPGIDENPIFDHVTSAWDKAHPDLEIQDWQDLSYKGHDEWEDDPWGEDEGLTNYASFDIIGGMKTSMFGKKAFNEPHTVTDPEGTPWQMYQMESGEYPNHHAIMVDNNNHRMFLNYHGHHGPMMEAAMNSGIPGENLYNTVQGHYRLEPSDHEPFGEGWGFHHGSLTPFQEEAFSHALQHYHGVDDLEKAWVKFKEATVKWIGKVIGKTWEALYDREEAILYIWTHGGSKTSSTQGEILNEIIGKEVFFKNGNLKLSGKFTQAEGTYTTISYILAAGAKEIEKEKEKVRELLEKTLTEKWPTVSKKTHFKPVPQRFMVKKDGEVLMGNYKSHYDLIVDWLDKETAEKYSNYDVGNSDYPFVTGGFLDSYGIIRLIHTPGEVDYDPEHIARLVYDDAKVNGDFVSGKVKYEDWRNSNKPTSFFHINPKGGTA